MQTVRLKFTKDFEKIDRIQIRRIDGMELNLEAQRNDGTVLRCLTRYAVETVFKAQGFLIAISKAQDSIHVELNDELWKTEVLVRAIEQEDSFEDVSIRRILSTVGLLCSTLQISPHKFRAMDIECAVRVVTDLRFKWNALSEGNSFEIFLDEI